ncbi:TPA: hypothetical protein N0F65_013065 [Lagenidium giganteum]|uniref:Transposase n=1 Tax=Lagenidium giganteum TaxID=4803 RepID=A0AAV2YHW5_9STRA|nr:TPA: hypothetical protein N0F65_013065 [Lagenidium giganteum]
MRFALSFIDETTRELDAMVNVVHLDEKWFYHDRAKRTYYLLPDEQRHKRQRHSARFIEKSMFLVAIARPRYDYHRKARWSGKLGVSPFVEDYVAKKKSKNRPAGTLLLKNMESVTREIYKCFILQHVFPAIKKEWPRQTRHQTIWVQQDNCRVHIPIDDPDVVTAGKADGWDIRFRCQPARSPVDLGFFASLQSTQQTLPVGNTKMLLDAVQNAYDEMSVTTVDNVLLTLQAVMLEILRCRGDNSYAMPHIGKASLRKEGLLPESLHCDQQTFDGAIEHLITDALVFS